MVGRRPTYEDGLLVIQRLMRLAQDTFGDVAIHSTSDGGWCAHAGMGDEKGCSDDNIYGALLHALREHGLLSDEVISHHLFGSRP